MHILKLILINLQEFNKQVLIEYLNSFNFQDIDLLTSFRIFFSNFLMFGEAQCIERVLDQYTQIYFKNNKSFFKHSDPLYTFIYAMILLNTDQYSKGLDKKMTFQDFAKNCEKINQGEDLPESYLIASYNGIKTQEITAFKSRDMTYEQNVNLDVWNYYILNKDLYEDLVSVKRFSPPQDELLNSDFIKVHAINFLLESVQEKINQNIDIFVQSFVKDSTAIKSFFDAYILICVKNDSFRLLDQLIQSLIDKLQLDTSDYDYMQKEDSSNQMVLTSLVAVSRSFTHLNSQLKRAFHLILSTVSFRLYYLQDDQTILTQATLKMIRESTNFFNKNIHNKKSLFSMLADFLEYQESSSDEDIDQRALQFSPKKINEKNLMKELFEQSRFLDDNDLIKVFDYIFEFANQSYKKSQNGMLLSHHIDLAIQLALHNKKRINLVWSLLTYFLYNSTSKTFLDNIQNHLQCQELIKQIKDQMTKKQNKKLLSSSYFDYSLLNLCFLHLKVSEDLQFFDECLQRSLDYLNDCSVEILNYFLQEIIQQLHSDSIDQQKPKVQERLILVVKKFISVLESKNQNLPEIQSLIQQLFQFEISIILKITDINVNHIYQPFKKYLQFFQSNILNPIYKYIEIPQLVQKTLQNVFMILQAQFPQIEDKQSKNLIIECLITITIHLNNNYQIDVQNLLKSLDTFVQQLEFDLMTHYSTTEILKNIFQLFRDNSIIQRSESFSDSFIKIIQYILNEVITSHRKKHSDNKDQQTKNDEIFDIIWSQYLGYFNFIYASSQKNNFKNQELLLQENLKNYIQQTSADVQQIYQTYKFEFLSGYNIHEI